MTAFLRDTLGGAIRQGITIAGIDVVIVAATMTDVDLIRETTELATNQHGPHLLTFAGHPVVAGDQPGALVDVVKPSVDRQLRDYLDDDRMDVFRIAIPIAREVYDEHPDVADRFVAQQLEAIARSVAAGQHRPTR